MQICYGQHAFEHCIKTVLQNEFYQKNTQKNQHKCDK